MPNAFRVLSVLVLSAVSLAAQPPAEFFARWVGIAHTFNRRRNQPPTTPRHILGTVAESEDLVHVVYRGVGWVPVVQIQIMSVARIDGQWLLVQNSDVVQAPGLPFRDAADPQSMPAA